MTNTPLPSGGTPADIAGAITAAIALVGEDHVALGRHHGIGEDEVLEKVLLADAAVKRLVEPEEVGGLALWLATEHAALVSGASYTIDGGWTAQ